jgi:hypothetical protein
MIERYTCEVCGGNSWETHDLCDAILYRRQAEIVAIVRDNPWLGFFLYMFEKWAKDHPNYMLDK